MTAAAGQQSPELRSYIKSITPPRELICPITLDLFTDPVIALGDGYTYERKAISTWIQSQQASGTGGPGAVLRSPVTNAYMETSVPSTTLIDNKLILSIVQAFRERLGSELCRRCQRISTNHNLLYTPMMDQDLEGGSTNSSSSSHNSLNCSDPDVIIGDEHDQIKALVDAGADLSVKACDNGSTAIMVVCFFLIS